jgi:hypothetical protein
MGKKHAIPVEGYARTAFGLTGTISFVDLGSTYKEKESTQKEYRAVIIFSEALLSVVLALAVGMAIILPMLIMVLHPSETTNLVTTCVFVFSFAVGLALLAVFMSYHKSGNWAHKAGRHGLFLPTIQPKDVLMATAAYAAVLVVFVGTSISPGNSVSAP